MRSARTAGHLQQTGHPLEEQSCWLAWRSMPSSTVFRSKRPIRKNWRSWRHLLLLQRSGERTTGTGQEIRRLSRSYTDNYFAALNSAVFLRRFLCLYPQRRALPMELSTYFRINERNTDSSSAPSSLPKKGSHVSYLEGCTAPMRDETSSTPP